MKEPEAENANRPPALTSVPDFPQREPDGLKNGMQYDPRIPEEVALQKLKEDGSKAADDAAFHAEAFRSTPGEELRPKDGTLDGGTAR